MEVIFRSPFYLWALLIIPVLIIVHFLSIKYSKRRAIKFANFATLARISEKTGISSNFSILFLRILVFIAVVFAIAGTSIWYVGTGSNADYVIAIDASASMLADDFSPSRIQVSKDAASSFVGDLPIYSDVGLLSFAGTTYVNQPLTNDKRLIKEKLQGVEIINVGGTDLGDAVVTGTNLLMNSEKSKVVIILTDGRSNIGLGVQEAIDYANIHNVLVNAIGIGTEEGYFVELEKGIGPLGVNIAELELIAQMTGGDFFYPKTTEELEQIYSNIAKSKKTKISFDLSFFLLLFMMVALSLEWILINTRYRIIP